MDWLEPDCALLVGLFDISLVLLYVYWRASVDLRELTAALLNAWKIFVDM
jgi:hypothetical protein